MNDSELLAQLRALAAHVPSLASILAKLDAPKVKRERKAKRVKRIRLGSRPLNAGKFPECGVNYAPRLAPLHGPQLPREERANRYRAHVDACAEAEGEAIESFDNLHQSGIDLLTRAVAVQEGECRASRIVRRFAGTSKGNTLSTWHYLRALSRSVSLNATDDAKRGECSLILRRYDYRRAAAQAKWDEFLSGRMGRGATYSWRDRLPGWARETLENDATRSRRQLQRHWRDVIRAVGAAKIAGTPGAAELFAVLLSARVA